MKVLYLLSVGNSVRRSQDCVWTLTAEDIRLNPMSEQLHDSYEKCYYNYKVLMNFVIARRNYDMKRDIFDDWVKWRQKKK